MKEKSKMESRVGEGMTTPMAMFMKDTGKTISEMAKVLWTILMEKDIKANGLEVRSKAKANITIQMVQFIKEIL